MRTIEEEFVDVYPEVGTTDTLTYLTGMSIQVIFRNIFSKEEQEPFSRLNQVRLLTSVSPPLSSYLSFIRYINVENQVQQSVYLNIKITESITVIFYCNKFISVKKRHSLCKILILSLRNYIILSKLLNLSGFHFSKHPQSEDMGLIMSFIGLKQICDQRRLCH